MLKYNSNLETFIRDYINNEFFPSRFSFGVRDVYAHADRCLELSYKAAYDRAARKAVNKPTEGTLAARDQAEWELEKLRGASDFSPVWAEDRLVRVATMAYYGLWMDEGGVPEDVETLYKDATAYHMKWDGKEWNKPRKTAFQELKAELLKLVNDYCNINFKNISSKHVESFLDSLAPRGASVNTQGGRVLSDRYASKRAAFRAFCVLCVSVAGGYVPSDVLNAKKKIERAEKAVARANDKADKAKFDLSLAEDALKKAVAAWSPDTLAEEEETTTEETTEETTAAEKFLAMVDALTSEA